MELGDVPDEGRVAAEGHAGDEPLEGRGDHDGHECRWHLLRQLRQKQTHEESDCCYDSSKNCLLALNEWLPLGEGVEAAELPACGLGCIVGSGHKLGSCLSSLDFVNVVVVAELRQANNQCEAVAEADLHRHRDQAHQVANAEEPRNNLEKAHEHHRIEEVLHAMSLDDRPHEHCNGSSRAAHHCGAAAQEGGHEANEEGGDEPNLRLQARGQREGHSLRHHGKRNGYTAECLLQHECQ
mmetsp:Transcript_13634/g.37186  ORF Transcript_13634/g.37186 Transcript_13634/m.37186 type:complete len:239 (-) Transcript_13634:305-1021(-)